MKKVIVFLFLLILFLFPIISADFVDDEMQKITYYAEEYEIGNINYVQLLVYTSAVRQSLNEILGATEREHGGILKQDQIKSILGESNEQTKWVWVDGLEHETRLSSYVPVWKKIIFDGKKIQIRLNAWPSVFMKKEFEDKEKFKEEEQNFKEKEFTEKDIIYRLDFETEFKKPKEQLDIQGKIKNIQTLAQIFNSDSSRGNGDKLAKESVNAERIFENYFRQNQGKCEDLMKAIFGSENQRQTQKLLVQEIDFYEGDKFEVIARLEMCDDCEWNWINLDLWLEGRGFGIKIEEGDLKMISPEQFKNMDFRGFERRITELLDEYKQAIDERQWKKISGIKQEIWVINDAWNQKSNDVWEQIDNMFGGDNNAGKIIEGSRNQERVVEDKVVEGNSQDDVIVENTIGEEDTQTNVVVENTLVGNMMINENKIEWLMDDYDNYGWIKEEQAKKKMEKKLRKENYEKRKQFYLNLFSGYEKRESYFTQVEFEKRLVEEFKEFGEEICDNNIDDNEDEKVDCDDKQCGGKFCGKTTVVLEEGNQTREGILELYCIAGECKVKEELVKKIKTICGNHICEENETIETCAEDCSLCPQYSAINCSGKVIFSGKDENGCPMEPVCIVQKDDCEFDEDCIQPLCGKADCIEGKCMLIELSECRESDCVDGDEKVKNCDSGEQIVAEKCIDGLWRETGVDCEVSDEVIEGVVEVEIVENEIVGEECSVRGDCGGENDVCSNGKCVTIPQVIEAEDSEIEEIVLGDEISEESEDGEIIEDGVDEEPAEEIEESGFEEPAEEQEEVEEVEESEPEEQEENIEESAPVTGEIIFNFFRAILGRITGATVDEGSDNGGDTAGEGATESFDEGESDDGSSQGDESDGADDVEENFLDETEGDVIEENFDEEEKHEEFFDEEKSDENWEDKEGERREREDKEQERDEKERREEDKKRCAKDCSRPCIEKCIRESCGEELDCNVDEEQRKCEGSCKAEEDCVEKCMKGGDWWKEFEQEQEEHKEEKGVFMAGGSCRTSQGKTEGFIWFNGWGNPFDKIQPLKTKYYSGGEAEWCKYDLENLRKQRKEFEKGFNQEFVAWFFEKYLANSAEDWEQAQSGIYELYWNNVDNQRQTAERMKCLGINELPEYNLISMNYETEFGSLEYWEEVKTVKIPGLEGEHKIISPYMKVWIFPPKKFIIYEMKQSMKNHEFPGSPEEKMERGNQEGPTEEEREMIKQDKGFMKKIRKISEKYGGNVNAVVQFKDYETDEVVFNLYVQVNEDDILKMEPMLVEEVPEEDVRIELDFEKIYDMIYVMEKEMRGAEIESPPWDRRARPLQKIKEITNGIKMYFKVNAIINSAKVYPEEAKKDVKTLFKTFFSMMMKKGMEGEDREDFEDEDKKEEKEVWESKEKITGEAILQY